MRDAYRSSLQRELQGWGSILAVALLAMGTGCSGSSREFRSEDQFGRTYYIEGAGNWGFGRLAVPEGLRHAGYQGRIASYRWSVTLNPLLDQTVCRGVAKAQGKRLAREIEHYLEQYPNNEVHIIGQSAGTGVAVWACEHLKAPAKVSNVILLSSSLSSDYEMSKALANIRGTVFVYYSPHDGILGGPVRLLGTIDGTLGSQAAGLVGLQCSSPKIRNIPWNHRFEAYGWTGTHVSTVQADFVRHVLSHHVIPETHVLTAEVAHSTEPGSSVRQ
ncbi:MAG: hypothetical protein GX616_19270 [Planctomycetes bacterium]|nr:hypothetical protein [Planctomycetota bacterium]